MTDQDHNQFIKRYARLLKTSIDVRDWGVKYEERPVSQQTNEALWESIQGYRRACYFTKARLLEHVRGERTYYYRSGRIGPTAMLMIDIDAHHGEPDALEVTELLRHRCFPGTFAEPSTNGRGFHLYARVELLGSRRIFNESATLLEHALNHLAIDHNLQASVEIKGTCTLLEYDFLDEVEEWASHTRDGGGYVASGGRVPDSHVLRKGCVDHHAVPRRIFRRGSLAKLPRLHNGFPDLDCLASSPIFTQIQIRSVIENADLGDAWESVQRGKLAPKLSRDQLRERLEPIPIKSEFCRPERTSNRRTADKIDSGNRPRSNTHIGCVAQFDDDAFVRTRAAAFELCRTLDRVPTVGELYEHYMNQGYNRGIDVQQRRHRMCEVLAWVADVFDPNVGRPGFERRCPVLLQAIATHVRPEHLAGTGYDRRIADRELAVMLYVVERGTFDRRQPARRRWTLPREAMEAFAARLACDGVKCGKWPKRKFYAARRILQRAGLIRCIDDVHLAAGPAHGVAHKFHVGRNHPLDAEFRNYCRQAPPEVQTVKGACYWLTRPFDGSGTEIETSISAAITVKVAISADARDDCTTPEVAGALHRGPCKAIPEESLGLSPMMHTSRVCLQPDARDAGSAVGSSNRIDAGCPTGPA